MTLLQDILVLVLLLIGAITAESGSMLIGRILMSTVFAWLANAVIFGGPSYTSLHYWLAYVLFFLLSLFLGSWRSVLSARLWT